jgi:uncharacterized repeat protein (TIGR04138 family)
MPDRSGSTTRIQEIASEKGRYRPEAYQFVLDALERTLSGLGERRHVTGEELLGGIRALAQERFGLLAKDVLNAWGLRETLDFGHVVFHMVEADLLRKTEEDSLSDFADRFDFQRVFEENYFDERSGLPPG